LPANFTIRLTSEQSSAATQTASREDGLRSTALPTL
jgi:hypothetical protein